MDPIWEKLHSTRAWGKYPAESLIQTVMRAFSPVPVNTFHALEMGCGGGANLSFLINEGFHVYGIDGAPSAVETTRRRLQSSVAREQIFDLRVGDFSDLPWEDESFDLVIDYLAIYANPLAVIQKSYNEAYRVLKPGGFMFSRTWGVGCTGDKTGKEIEPGTSENPTEGPCKNMGVSHFFTSEEMKSIFSVYSSQDMGELTMHWPAISSYTIEWIMWAKK